MRTEPAKCCGKRRYRTKAKAEKAKEKWQAVRGDSGPVRTYRCPHGFYHLTHLSRNEYFRISKTTHQDKETRKDVIRKVIQRDGRCVVCGSSKAILSIHPRVALTPLNEYLASTFVTAHHECLHHGSLSSDEKFYRGYKLDSHMSKDAPLYPIWNYDHWYYPNTDGTVQKIDQRVKR